MTSINPRKNDALVGAVTGLVTGVLLQPLEIIKVCLIVNPTHATTIRNSNFLVASYSTIKVIHQMEGIKGFWKGLSPALLEMIIGSAIYFESLGAISNSLRYLDMKGAYADFIASGVARANSSFFSNPFSVIRTRVQLPGFSDYSSVYDGIKKIRAQEGIRGFFKGALPGVLKDAPFAALYFSLMNIVKTYLQPFKLSGPANTMAAGMLAGMIATSITHPLEVVKTLVQVDSSNNYEIGIIQRLRLIWLEQGLRGYTKGLAPRLVKKPLTNAMAFTVFEVVRGRELRN